MGVDFNKKGLGGGAAYTFVSPDNSIDITEVDKEVQLQVNRQVTFTLPVSSDPAIDNAKYNDFGLLTDNVTITYPTTEPGEVKIYYGQFQTDLDNLYTVDFGNDVILTGDTEMHPYSIYLFQIVGNFVLLKEIKFGGLKNKVIGKVVSGFSGDHVVISVNGTNTNVSVGSDGWFFYDVAPSVTSVKFNTADKTNFEKIYLVDVNGFTNCSDMFNGCSGLTSIDLSNFDTDEVTNMSGMFSGCSGLTSIDVSNFNTANVTDMSNMFNYCSGLTSIDVTNFNTAKVANISYMFYRCIGLTSIDVSNFVTDSVTNMSNMFNGCSGLTSIDVTNFNTANVTNISQMFYGCSGLTSIDLSNFNMNSTTNMSTMFASCTGLTNANLDNIVIGQNTNTSGMFNSCNNLTVIYLRNSDTTTYDKINAVKPAGATIVTAA